MAVPNLQIYKDGKAMKQANEYHKSLDAAHTSSETAGSRKQVRQKRVVIGLIIFIVGLVLFMSVTMAESPEGLFKNIIIGFWLLAIALWFAGGWGVLFALFRIKPQRWWEMLFLIA